MTATPGGGAPPPWPTTWWARAGIVLVNLWWMAVDAGRVAWACRAALLATLAGGILIAFTDQARDIVIAEVGKQGGGHVGATGFVAVWAITGWYWARATLYLSFAVDPVDACGSQWQALTQRERDFRMAVRGFATRNVPRLIGAAAIASLVVAFDNAAIAHDAAGDAAGAALFRTWTWIYAALALLFYLAVAFRRRIMRALLPGDAASPLVPGPAHFAQLRDLLGNVIAATFLVVTLALTPLLCWRFIADPVGTSAFLGGAVNAVLLGLATMVPVFSLLVLLAKRSRLPLFGGTVLWLALAPWLFADNHDVRSLAATTLPARAPVGELFERWWSVNARPEMTRPIAVPADGDDPLVAPPFVIVATAGGASRAAFWTSQVLGEIAAREPAFADRLFMISGVSGGSLGATLFRSMVEADRRGGAGPRVPVDPAGRARGFMESDFLGPSMAAGFYVDLPFRALSFLPRGVLPDDRAAALEKAWEAAWRASIGRNGAAGFDWSDGFLATFTRGAREDDYRAWPILALNGVAVEKGKRIITSNAGFGTSRLSGDINRYDGFDILGRDLAISTAVTMSARFPIISPAGGMRGPDGRMRTRVIDGGLFENFGAATADEVLRYVVERRADVQYGRRPVVPIAILISSDPSLDHLDRVAATGYRERPAGNLPPVPDCGPVAGPPRLRTPAPVIHPGNGWPECPVDGRQSASLVIDPALALYDGRVARGEQAATAMLDRIDENRTVVRDRLIQRLARLTGGDVRQLDATQVEAATAGSLREGMASATRVVVGRLGTQDHVDFFHFRQCRVPGMKGPTMSWHDSQEAWRVMRIMTGLEPDAGDPCGNAAELFRLCVRLARLSGQADDDMAATTLCETGHKWPRPAAWKCDQFGAGAQLRWYCRIAAP